jgi:GNAT superfamily N-acetyltransferase
MPTEVTVRKYEPRDREAVREICRLTGLKGDPTWRFFEDAEILTAIYADYYLDHEAELCLVAEKDGQVVGYLLFCRDTKRKNRIMMTRVFPRLVLRAAWKLLTLQYRQRHTYDTLWWILTRSWKERFRKPLDEFPMHAHLNVHPDHRSGGIGRVLNEVSRKNRTEQNLPGDHFIIREPEGEERLSEYFLRERSYRLLETRRFTLWDRVTGKKWYARLLVRDPEARGRLGE